VHRPRDGGSGARSRLARRRRCRRVYGRRTRARAGGDGLRLKLRDVAAGALVAGGIAVTAQRARTLTGDGALAAFGVGTLTYGSGALPYTSVLLAFFVPSVFLSRIGRTRKRALVDIAKGGARDAVQVGANGGIATLCAMIAGAAGGRWNAAFAGAYAAANADTWGTEIGTLARSTPYSLVTGEPVATGLSGGVTLAGTLAECAGALAVATVAAAALRPKQPARFTSAVTLGGIGGAFADSYLGATVQELRYCPGCERHCETNPHECGLATQLVRGIPGFSNDVVNLAATIIGATIAYVLA
jgi:uncharacterized protein (TIGR00297 family)